METLKDWWRYVERVSRPARRDSGEDAEAAHTPWRPWLTSTDSDSEEVVEAVRPEQMPNLARSLGSPALLETRQKATQGYEDLTVHDELEPIPQFTVPELEA